MQHRNTRRDIKIVYISWAIAYIPVIYIRIFKHVNFLDHYFWLYYLCYTLIACLLGLYFFGNNAVQKRHIKRELRNKKLKPQKMRDFYKGMSNRKIKNKFL